MKGANIVHLMDDEVSLLGSDGSSSNVITTVSYAVNQKGRDDLTRLNLRAGGRHRLLKAYAVGPDGIRQEASIRGRTVRFRQLKVGSTVVLQYRTDEPSDGYWAVISREHGGSSCLTKRYGPHDGSSGYPGHLGQDG